MVKCCLYYFVITLGYLLFIQGKLFAQESQSNVDKSRQLLRNQMEMKLKEFDLATEGSTDEDLGEQVLVKRKPKPWSLTLSSDIGEFWSNNTLLVDSTLQPTQSDFALTHNDQATLAYRFSDELSFSGNYRYSIFRYNRLISQNFDTHSAGGSLNYSFPYDINLYTGIGWTTIYSAPVGDSVYEEADWNIGVNKVIPLNFTSWLKDRAAWFVGYQTDMRLASPKDYDKIEVSPYTGIYYAFTPKLIGQTFYRWQYQHYQRYGRKDYNNSVTGSLAWNPLEWLTVSGFAGFTDNRSGGREARSYAVFNTGASVRFYWKF